MHGQGTRVMKSVFVGKTRIDELFSYRHPEHPTIIVEKGTGKMYYYDLAFYNEVNITKEELLSLGYTVVYPMKQKVTIKIF